jgi:tetratricopeptide (TPR) repeat protein
MISSLAEVYLAQRRNTEAESLYEQIIPRIERTFGTDRDLVKALITLAEAYQADGRYEKAELLYRRVLVILDGRPRLTTGATFTAVEHYEEMLRKLKRKAEAQEVNRELNSILRR